MRQENETADIGGGGRKIAREADAAWNARGAAAAILARWLETGEFPDRMVREVARSRAFVTEVTYGVARWRRELDWILGRLASGLATDDVRVHAWLGLYEAFHMTAPAEHALVHENVEAAKARGRRAAGFVNAVLRRALREREAIRAAIAAAPLGVRASHPDALLHRWERQFGAGAVERLCAWNNRPAEVVLHVNRARVEPDAFLNALDRAGWKAAPHPFRPGECVTWQGRKEGEVSSGDSGGVEALPGYAEGWFSVQDPSTLVAVELLDPRPGESVLDACAAPGGKTILAAERMCGQGRLVAAERHGDRMGRLRANLERMGAGWVTPVQSDIAALDRTDAFDAVLLDVPCSNTGVLRRRADARWRFSEERLRRLTAAQENILRAGLALVRPGGRVVYSTCSLEAEENEELVCGPWVKQAGFQVERAVRLFPPDTETDGAYAARLVRELPAGARP